MGVPTMYGRLLQDAGLTGEACERMRLFVSGSAPLLPAAFEEFQAKTGHTILERYGMSEPACCAPTLAAVAKASVYRAA